mgnify:CR=1 FL=1
MKPYEYGLMELDVPSFNTIKVLVLGVVVWIVVWLVVGVMKRKGT